MSLKTAWNASKILFALGDWKLLGGGAKLNSIEIGYSSILLDSDIVRDSIKRSTKMLHYARS